VYQYNDNQPHEDGSKANSRNSANKLTNSMEQSLSWEAHNHSASKEIPAFYGTPRFFTTRTRHWSLSWAR